VDRALRALNSEWGKERVEREWTSSSKDEGSRGGFRSPQQRDRDRVLYCSALQRLAYITQVTAPESGYSFHNRLSHSLKVAQVGRRNAERLRKSVEDKQITGSAAELVLSVDPDAIEASCLAHDLGHPPFGHIAEAVLQAKGSEYVEDSFEGNAQSFRIVTRLAVRDPAVQGLDLTRETLGSLLKYPWRHWSKDPLKSGKREQKWGYYRDDKAAFDFAREGWPREAKNKLPEKSLGAEIMDWADDLTYAVHDVDDFFRAGLVPLDRLRREDEAEIKRLTVRLEEVKEADAAAFPDYKIEELVEAVQKRIAVDGPGEPYAHTKSARADMREFGSKLITRYLEAFSVVEDAANKKARLKIDPQAELEVVALKMLVVVYVIHRPSLAVVQHGQEQLIGDLFECYFRASSPSRRIGNYHLFPPGARERLEAEGQNAASRARVVLDLISGLTETAAIQLHRRLCGSGTGPALDATALIG
jgi:dGTPase